MSSYGIDVDIAYISLIVFFLFFAGLVFYLRREDRREGFPLADEYTGKMEAPGMAIYLPKPKTFRLMHGHGEFNAPNLKPDRTDLAARRVGVTPGSPIEPVGDPMKAGIGPGAWAERANIVEYDAHGKPKLVPMRDSGEFQIAGADADPRGMVVIGADGEIAGTVSDIWVDRPEALIRYLEVTLGDDKPAEGENVVAAGKKTVLLPIALTKIKGKAGQVMVHAITAEQFADVPQPANPDQVTLHEEELIVAYYGGGYLYAMPSRQEPLL